MPPRIDIAARPAIVGAKARLGDGEGDPIVGGHQQGALLTPVERNSLCTTISRWPCPTAHATHRATVRRLKPRRDHVPTMTYDHGNEFAGHRHTAHIRHPQIFVATPEHAWERGVHEHTTGLIRDCFPKGTNFPTLHPAPVTKVKRVLTGRPRKSLGFQPPNEVFRARAKRG